MLARNPSLIRVCKEFQAAYLKQLESNNILFKYKFNLYSKWFLLLKE